jgi:predicted DNA-binding ribbon-helix-helix protein
MNRHAAVRNVQMKGTQTVVAVEPYFWLKLEEISEWEQPQLSSLLHKIDANKGQHTQAAAVRIFVTAYFLSAAASKKKRTAPAAGTDYQVRSPLRETDYGSLTPTQGWDYTN